MLDFLNTDNINPEHAPKVQLPHIQWSNKEPAGFEFAEDLWSGFFGDEATKVFKHGKNRLKGFHRESLKFCYIGHRWAWETYDATNGKTLRGKLALDSGLKVYGRIHAFGLVKGVNEDTPAFLTLRGTVQMDFSSILKRVVNEVVKPIGNIKKAQIPTYFFWIPLKVGDSVYREGKNNQGFEVYPMLLDLDTSNFKNKDMNVIGKAVKAIYVGDTIKDLIQNKLYDEFLEWKSEWDTEEGLNPSNESSENNFASATNPPPPPVIQEVNEDEIPF